MNAQQKAVINRCRTSVFWFLETFGKVKHPAAGILPFKLFSYQKKALIAFKSHRFNIFKKCRQCFTGDQYVWGPNGPKRIDEIKIGDPVYTLNDITNAIEITHVDDVYDNGISDELVEVRSKTGHRSISTSDHLYLTNSGYTEANNITQNDRLIEINDLERYGLTPCLEDPILLGYLLTDDSTGRFVTFNNSCWKYLLEYQKCFETRFGSKLAIRKHASGFKPSSNINYRLQTTNIASIEWAREYGILNKIKADKKIPDIVFKWDNKSIATLINRMFAGDGWYAGGNCNEAGIGLESITMLQQLKQLLTRFGINAVYYPRTNNSIPKLRICGKDDFNRFVQYIGIFGKKPRNEITKGFFFNRNKGDVKSVKQLTRSDRVYDLHVPPYNNYIVDGAVVHNCGISKISGAFALWFAMFNPNKTILIVSRKDDDAKGFLKENIAFLFNHLPEWMQDMWAPKLGSTGRKGWNEHSISFTNGSVIRSMTSHPDVLRSNASSLNIIDEAAFIQDMDVMWAAGYSTMTHGGSTIVISTCVAPDTYIWTENGMQQIKELAPEKYTHYEDGYHFIEYNGPKVLGINGLEQPSKFYMRPTEPTKIIKYSYGYDLEASLKHKLYAVHDDGSVDKKFVRELQIGDWIPVKCGAMVFGNDDTINYVDDFKNSLDPIFKVDTITPELGYLLGVLTAEGHVDSKYVTISCGDEPVLQKCIEWLDNDIKWQYESRYYNNELSTHVLRTERSKFSRFLKWLGVEWTTAPYKKVPHRILQCSQPIIVEFLKGLFDGDGSSATRDGKISLISTSKELIKQVRYILFNFGIMCREDIKKPRITSFKNKDGTLRLSNTHESYELSVLGQYYDKFYDLIGFGLNRKNKNRKSKINMTYMPPQIIQLLKNYRNEIGITLSQFKKYGVAPNILFGRKTITKERLIKIFDKIPNEYKYGNSYELIMKLMEYDHFIQVEELIESESEVYDFTMPETHTFIGNGNVQVNTNGTGNWYWSTWTDAECNANTFNAIRVDWWDMDWSIEYKDSLNNQSIRISPRDGLRECKGKEEIDKYGPYWSPWLEEQWLGLQEKGEGWKFNQEVLASFIGSGNTVLPKSVLTHIVTTVIAPQRIVDNVTYIDPQTNQSELLNFRDTDVDSGLWIWKEPVIAKDAKVRGGKVIEEGVNEHYYVMGIDFATGKGKDYHSFQVLDAVTLEQVAEMMIRCLPHQFLKYVDFVGRWYNNALIVPERNNGGDNLIDTLRLFIKYPNIWRKKDINDKPRPNSSTQRALKVSQYGFYTSAASKPVLNRLLLDCVRDEKDAGFTIYSKRLLKQFNTYVRKRSKTGHDTDKTEAEDGANNYDDLVIAFALGLVGINDSFAINNVPSMPIISSADYTSMTGPLMLDADQTVEYNQQIIAATNNPFIPFIARPDEMPEQNIQRQLDAFTCELGAIPMANNVPLVVPPKYFYNKKKKK